MAGTAQARLTKAQNLDALDEKPTMERSRRAALRRHERGMDDAYKAGRADRREQLAARPRRGLVRPAPLDDAYPLDESGENIHERQAYEDGARDELAAARRSAASKFGQGARDEAGRQYRSHARAPIREGSGFLLGLFAYALFLSYMRDGIDGPKKWLKAKFINETPATKTAPKPKPKAPTAPTTPTAPVPNARIPYTTVAYVPTSPLAKAGPG